MLRINQLIIMCVAILPVNAFAQWNISYNSGSFYSTSVVAIGADTAVLTGNEYGLLYRTDNGGASWGSFQTPFTSSWFFDLDFVSKSVGYAVGGTFFGTHTDIIVRTLDGGVTWDSISANSGLFGYTIDHVDFVNIDTGFVAGHSGLKMTTNGGTGFSTIPHSFNSITELYFDQSGAGYVAETKALLNNYTGYYIWKTNDMGMSWSMVYSDSLQNANGINNRMINRIQMINGQVGYASGGNSTILKTNDGGNTWTRSSIPPNSSNLTGMWFTDENTGYVNNAGGIYKTIDGGLTWMVQTVSPVGIITHISFGDDDHGYAGGDYGIYVTVNGGQATNLEEVEPENLTLYPNPSKDILNISLKNSENFTIRLYDMEGRQLNLYRNMNKIDVSMLDGGSYWITITTKDSVFKEQFVKI